MIYPNPLDKFRSYSVHHILLVGRSTEEAKDFCDEDQNVQTLEAITRVTQLGESVNYKGKSDKIFLVLDSRRFSQFTIENLRYDVLMNGLVANQSHANLATDISLTVIDSVGISFINFLQWLYDVKLKTNSEGTIFLLKTIFVGHNEDGSSETVYTATLPMHMQNMSLNLDYIKGAYTCEFFANSNFNISKQYRWFHIGQASSFFTGKGSNTLGQMVSSFEQSLNKRSSEHYNKVQENVKKQGGQATSFGRQVKYMITLPESWENFDFNGKAEANSTETSFLKFQTELTKKEENINSKHKEAIENKKKETEAERTVTDTHLTVQSGVLITEVLDIMFGQVDEIKRMGNNKQSSEENGFVTFYKYITAITSDDSTVTVHVDVVEFKVPNKILIDKNKNTISKEESQFYKIDKDGKKVPNNYVEYNYIFTGLNKDILSLDLKIEDLQFLLASNIKVSEGKYFLVNDTGTDKNRAEGKVPETGVLNQYDPILMPINTKQSEENFSQYSMPEKSEKASQFIANSQEYSKNLSMFYAARPIQTNMVIKGNPDLLRKFNIGTVMSNVQATTNLSPEKGNSIPNAQTHQGYRRDLEERVLKSLPSGSKGAKGSFDVNNGLDSQTYATAPVFVKINIKGPNVDFKTNEMIKGQDFATDVLSDIYFAVFKMSHIFEGSNFTQEIELYSHNIYSGDASKPVIANNRENR